tara:strand:- start:265 stop:423 length:159 start_codon:yes stop_codon:yes gene_type:complete
MIENESDLIAEILMLTSLLDGTAIRSTTYDSTGRTSKKITIEYDVKQEKRNG